MRNILKNRKLGFYLTILAAGLALIGAIAYLCSYAMTADPVTGVWDRVFQWTVFILMVAGAAVSVLGEVMRLHFSPIVVGVFFGIGFAQHFVQAAYPIADVMTNVRFFGGSAILAIVFLIVFGAAVMLHIVGTFFEHNTAGNGNGIS